MNKSTTMVCSDSLERVEKSHSILSDRVEYSITGQKASKWSEIVFSSKTPLTSVSSPCKLRTTELYQISSPESKKTEKKG